MSLKTKLQKLEKVSGLAENCKWCDFEEKKFLAFLRLQKEKGLHQNRIKWDAQKQKSGDYVITRCEYCGRSRRSYF